MSDSELAKRAQRGDREAFLTLIHRYHMPLYKLAYRFAGSVERAEDLCQEILIRAFVRLASTTKDAHFSLGLCGWLPTFA